MGKIEKISVALTPELASMVRKAVDGGSYASTSEVVRDALRVWRQQAEQRDEAVAGIRRLWQEGLESGLAADGKAVMAQLKRRYAPAARRKRA
jgi:antitoxin ParD1/3/4